MRRPPSRPAFAYGALMALHFAAIGCGQGATAALDAASDVTVANSQDSSTVSEGSIDAASHDVVSPIVNDAESSVAPDRDSTTIFEDGGDSADAGPSLPPDAPASVFAQHTFTGTPGTRTYWLFEPAVPVSLRRW